LDELLVEKDGSGVVVATLNRPKKRNAVSLALWKRLRETFEEFAADDSVRAVVLTGAAGHFSAGADISEFEDVRANAEMAASYEAEVERCYEAIFSLPKPTVAAIDGYAVGGGCALAMVCDFRVASTRAAFGIPAAKLGIVYSPRECRLLQSLVGIANAKRILFTGELVDAAKAHAMGLVDEVGEAEPTESARALAAGMARNAPLAIAGMKLTLNAIEHDTLDGDRERIEAITNRAFDSEDYQEGARAFMEKRPPSFTGR
jgi:enoyl-CoA hydratase/carnithine racemase